MGLFSLDTVLSGIYPCIGDGVLSFLEHGPIFVISGFVIFDIFDIMTSFDAIISADFRYCLVFIGYSLSTFVL